MVKILPNGDIVQDSDPRAKEKNTNNSTPQRKQQGFIQHEEYDEQQGGQEGGQQINMFHVLNQKLLDAGIPRWNAGPYVVEPIVSLGFLVAGLLIGIHGLIFAAILFFISKWSTSGGGNAFRRWFGGQNSGNRRQPRPGNRKSGGGMRLGRS